MARLLAAMSGGVDSSVAAALVVRDGHEVTGATLKQWEFPDEETRLSKGCCTLDAVADARRAADIIGIPHYTLDFREVFAREVVDPFVREYAAGRTPNPCIRCNELVRFGALADKAELLGFDGIVTGHYARVVENDGVWRLCRARFEGKDQSYVLHALSQGQLSRVRFPLGEMPSKQHVRELAVSFGLPNAGREDSVDVCFVGEDRRPGDVVAEREPAAVRPGPVLDPGGQVVGEHRGIPYYTVGQRRGLGRLAIREPGPRYVARIEPEHNALVVGGHETLEAWGLEATRPRFVHSPPRDGERLDAVVRYRGAPVEATYHAREGGFEVSFAHPVRAIAPGQACVLYRGDEVIGGGTIVSRR